MKKRLILIALAIIILLVGINLFTRGDYFSGMVKERVVVEARQKLGYEVGMDRLVFNLFPAYADLYKPYIKGWDNARPGAAISAEKIRVYISLGALIERRVTITRLRVNSPSLDIVKNPDGGYNIDDLVKKIKELAEEKGKKTGEGAPGTEVKELVVLDGLLSYSDKAAGVFFSTASAGIDFRMRGRGEYRAGFSLKESTLKRKDFPPFHIGLAGDITWKDDTARIDTVRIESEGTRINASGTVLWSKNPSVDLKVKAKLDLSLLDRLSLIKNGPSGEAELTGDVKGRYPDLKGAGSLTVRKAEYAGIKLDELSTKLKFENSSLILPEIKGRLLGGRFTGSLTANLGKEITYRSSLKVNDIISGYYTEGNKGLSFIPWQRVSGSVDILGSGLKAAGLSASGWVDIAKYEAPHSSPHADPDLAIIKDVRAEFLFRDRVITVNKCVVASRYSAVNLSGTVGIDGKCDLTLKGGSKNITEISTMIGYSDITGSLDATGYIRGNIIEPEIIGKARIYDAMAHGIPFKGAYGDVKLSGWQLSFSDFLITQDRSSFLLNGKIMFKGKDASFENPYFIAKLGVHNGSARKITAIFYEDIPVNLMADGEIEFSGNLEKFHGEARLSTGAGDVYGQPLDKGEVTAVLSEKSITFPKVAAVRGKDIITASGGINFDGTFYGKASSARFDLANFSLLMDTGLPIRGAMSIAVTGEGSFSHPSISANLNSNRLYLKDVDMGGSSIAARIKDEVLTLSGAILDKKVVVDGFLGLSLPYRWRGRLSFDKGRFEPFLKLLYKDLPEDVTFLSTGVFTGEGTIKEPAKTSMSVEFSEVSASIMGRRLENDGDIALAYKDGRLDIKSLKLKGDSISIEMGGGAEGLEQIDASLKVSTALGPLKSFVKDSVDYLDGNAQADLRIKGKIEAPAVTGRIKVSDAGIKLKEFQQRLDKINAEIKLDGSNFNITRLDGDLGGGIIKAWGKGYFKGFVLDNFAIGVNADSVKLKYPEGVYSTVDADLNIEGVGNSRSISGDVTVKKARYAERIDWKSWLVKIQRKKPEVVTAKGGVPLGNTSMNIHVVATESIRIDNNVAKVPVSSDIYLRGTIDNPAVLGRLESNGGVVYFRNNEFKLVNGVAEFVDPRRINPMVDLQAETKVKEYLISLSLSGTVDKIKVTLSSDPPLEDEDIISLLTLGRTSEGLKGHEAVVTTGEATSFVTGQIQDAVESRLRKITGFDRFQIDPYMTSSGSSSGPRLTVGKSLFSDKLYLTYSSNLGTSEDQFVRLEYIFNKNYSAVAERDELGHYGADFKFRFEFK